MNFEEFKTIFENEFQIKPIEKKIPIDKKRFLKNLIILFNIFTYKFYLPLLDKLLLVYYFD